MVLTPRASPEILRLRLEGRREALRVVRERAIVTAQEKPLLRANCTQRLVLSIVSLQIHFTLIGLLSNTILDYEETE